MGAVLGVVLGDLVGSDLNAVSCAVAVGVVVLGDRVLFKVFFFGAVPGAVLGAVQGGGSRAGAMFVAQVLLTGCCSRCCFGCCLMEYGCSLCSVRLNLSKSGKGGKGGQLNAKFLLESKQTCYLGSMMPNPGTGIGFPHSRSTKRLEWGFFSLFWSLLLKVPCLTNLPDAGPTWTLSTCETLEKFKGKALRMKTL